MAKIFNSVESKRPGSNKFDLSHGKKFSMNQGKLYPILVQETLPGASYNLHSEVMMRLAPLKAPAMERVNVIYESWFVPNRLVWDEWQNFITGGVDGLANPVHPYFDTLGNDAHLVEGALSDFVGIPPQTAPIIVNRGINALPFRAYQLIYDEFYRDQTLNPAIGCSKSSGLQTGATEINKLLTMRSRCWEKDMYTSALPNAQRGPAITLPIEADATVNYMDTSEVYDTGGNVPFAGGVNGSLSNNAGGELMVGVTDPLDPDGETGRIENIESVDVTSSNLTITALRVALKLQEWAEKMARGGARYAEQIKGIFGITPSDARLQRPKYLGGMKRPVSISEVLSNFQDPDGEGNPQGSMAGHGFSMGRSNGFKYRCEEHGFIIVMLSVLPRTSYQQGIARFLCESRWASKFGYAWPQFAHIGEQAILNEELYYDGATLYPPVPPEGTFGYTPRYAEYKFIPSSTHGAMRSSLAFWGSTRIFTAPPVLNGDFVTADPTNRMFAVTDEGTDHLWVQVYHKFSAILPLPYFGTPSI